MVQSTPAFAPGPGLPLSARPFATGRSLTSAPATSRSGVSVETPRMIGGVIDKLTSLLPFGKNNDGGSSVATAPAPVKPVVKANTDIVADIVEDPSPAADATAPAATAIPGLPKFYNPATARAVYKSKAAGQNSTVFDVRYNPLSPNPTASPIAARVNENDTFRNMDSYTEDLVVSHPDWSPTEASEAVSVALRNVFGNSHLTESDLDSISASISCVKKTAEMKEFVRALGLSDLYRTRFFEPMSNTRFVELNFLHFRGRAPYNNAEVKQHIDIVVSQGYYAEINSHVDSPEYEALFGNSRVPAPNFRGGHNVNNGMNTLAVLKGRHCTSDTYVTSAYFPSASDANPQGLTIRANMPDAWVGENFAREQAGFSADLPVRPWTVEPVNLNDEVLDWRMRYGVNNKFYYRDSIVYKEVMQPKLDHTNQEVAEAEAILKYGSNLGKLYVTPRKTFDVAPVIDITEPSPMNYGKVSLVMEEISTEIPDSLVQRV